MHPELQALLDTNRLKPELAERLNQLAPDNFCLHKTLGAGKITSWSLATGKITLDFLDKPNQEMGLKLAIEKTEPLDAGDFQAKKLVNFKKYQKLAISNPAALVVEILESSGGKLILSELDSYIEGSIVPAADYKKWWNKAKLALKKDRLADVPSRRNEWIKIKDANLAVDASIITDLEDSTSLVDRIKHLKEAVKNIEVFQGESREQLLEQLAEGNELISSNLKSNALLVMNLATLRDIIVAQLECSTEEFEKLQFPEISQLLKNFYGVKLIDSFNQFDALQLAVTFESAEEAFKDEYKAKLLALLPQLNHRATDEMMQWLLAKGFEEDIEHYCEVELSKRSLSVEMLLWICKKRTKEAEHLFDGRLAMAILDLIERDITSDGPTKSGRLKTFLLEERGVISEFIKHMNEQEIVYFAKALMNCSGFSDLEQKSLMARVINNYPAAQELLSNNIVKEEVLFSSQESIDRKQAELEDLIKNRIPKNVDEISLARSYGDLRENFEYKAAKQMQRMLMNRSDELDRDLNRVQVTDFKDVDTSQVNIGTTVELESLADGKKVTYKVLGAWDSNPEKHELSYLSKIGASFMNKKVGDIVVAPADLEKETVEDFKIVAISGV